MNASKKETYYSEAKEILERVSKMNNIYGSCALYCLENKPNDNMVGFVLELYDNVLKSGMSYFDKQLIEDIVKFGEKNKNARKIVN